MSTIYHTAALPLKIVLKSQREGIRVMESYQQKYSRPHPTKIHMKKNKFITVLVAKRPFYG